MSNPGVLCLLQAIDVWTGVCLTFVFGALLEFALVNYASRSDMHRDNIQKQRRAVEMEHANQLDASADLMEDGGNTFAMVGISLPPPPSPTSNPLSSVTRANRT